MKSLFLFFILLYSTSALSEIITREYSKLSNESAVVKITTSFTDYVQAAEFVDGREVQRFIEDLSVDETSELFGILNIIKQRYCSDYFENSYRSVDNCGEVTFTPEVMSSFGRGGWLNAYAEYSLFVGFTYEGSGMYFSVSHIIVLAEDVEALVNDNDVYAGKLVKNIRLKHIIAL